jgi:hypothetical protein
MSMPQHTHSSASWRILATTFFLMTATTARPDGKTIRLTLDGVPFVFRDDASLGRQYPWEATSIAWAVLAAPARIRVGGTTFALASGSEAGFFASGKPARCHPARDTACTIRGQVFLFRKNMAVNFYESGQIAGGYLARPTPLVIGANRFQAGRGESEQESIEFYKSGQIKKCLLAGEQLLAAGNQRFRAVGLAGFHESGPLAWAIPAADVTLAVGDQRIPFKAWVPYYSLSFYSNGTVQEGRFGGREPLVLGDTRLRFADGIQLRFDSRGRICRGVTAEVFRFGKTEFPTQTMIEITWRNDGRIGSVKEFRFPER